MRFLCKWFGHKFKASAWTVGGQIIEQKCGCGLYQYRDFKSNSVDIDGRRIWQDGEHPQASAVRGKPSNAPLNGKRSVSEF